MAKKMIILDISEEDYEHGRAMLNGAIVMAVVHGAWDNKSAERIFNKPWLPPWDELRDVEQSEE